MSTCLLACTLELPSLGLHHGGLYTRKQNPKSASPQEIALACYEYLMLGANHEEMTISRFIAYVIMRPQSLVSIPRNPVSIYPMLINPRYKILHPLTAQPAVEKV